MGNTKSLGIAYTDQDLSGGTHTGVTITGSAYNGTVGATTPSTGAFTTLSSTGSTTLGDAAADTIGFYGTTPATQRASSVQATTNIAVSASFGATQLACMQEIMNTLTGLGLWKGSA